MSDRLQILNNLKNKCNVQHDYSAAAYYARKVDEVSDALNDAIDKMQPQCL